MFNKKTKRDIMSLEESVVEKLEKQKEEIEKLNEKIDVLANQLKGKIIEKDYIEEDYSYTSAMAFLCSDDKYFTHEKKVKQKQVFVKNNKSKK
ncbi:MAG: hypothetical protein PF488_04755 [Patescibacteria group bacterium]|jgi:hypothetical protein|nr:hypothetical protein [Patescibacteria group bacterium]